MPVVSWGPSWSVEADGHGRRTVVRGGAERSARGSNVRRRRGPVKTQTTRCSGGVWQPTATCCDSGQSTLSGRSSTHGGGSSTLVVPVLHSGATVMHRVVAGCPRDDTEQAFGLRAVASVARPRLRARRSATCPRMRRWTATAPFRPPGARSGGQSSVARRPQGFPSAGFPRFQSGDECVDRKARGKGDMRYR
jgi:hypothetical protein